MENTLVKKSFSVEVSLTHPGVFFVFAKSPEDAQELVKENCFRKTPRCKSSHPEDIIGWCFPRSQIEKVVGDVMEATKQDTKKRGIIMPSPRKGEKQYRVDLAYTYRGEFCVDAENADEARDLIATYASQTYAQVCTKLPPDEVGWDCPREIIKKIGTIREKYLY